MPLSSVHSLQLTSLNTSHIPGLKALSSSVGWDYNDDELATVLKSGIVFGHITSQHDVISSAAVIHYKNTASIGLVIVNPDYQGMGMGKRLIAECLRIAPSDAVKFLVATDEGKPLYEKHGFNETGVLHKFLADTFTAGSAPQDTRFERLTYSEDDFEKLAALDEPAFGDNRSQFLCHRLQQASNCIVLKRDNGTLAGYGMSVQTPVNLIIGPLVAPDAEAAAFLTEGLVRHHQGKLRIDVTNGDEAFMAYLRSSGFKLVKTPSVMVHGGRMLPARNGTLFSVASQAFG